MTPAQLEHLKLIDAHLERLLAIAEKRTTGEWEHDGPDAIVGQDEAMSFPVVAQSGACVAHVIFNESAGDSRVDSKADATFIASCAGNAEAGWRATRAAIALLFAMCDGAHSINTVIAAQKMGESILAAFPLEALK